MRAWERPVVPRLPGAGAIPLVHDTASDALVAAGATGGVADLYVCGITPYDATHIGHAATYLAFDTLIRLWLDAGVRVRYAQNTTDVDDPLLERAAATGADWRQLAASQTELYRSDMQHLGVIPPDSYVAVTDVVDEIADAVGALLANGTAYRVGDDIYFDWRAAESSSRWHLGDESRYDRATMLALSAERGGDPDRPGKRDGLDPLLWRGERHGEPSWPAPFGSGRPGWHIECSVIAHSELTLPLTVKGGGRDLVFPHHEFSAGHTAALTGDTLASAYVHTGLVAYRGEKMSKSLGNLVFVSELIAGGVDPRAIRLAILANHYRVDWEWSAAVLDGGRERLERWSAARAEASGADSSGRDSTEAQVAAVDRLRAILANDLDTPAALAFIDSAGMTPLLATAIDALLGVAL